MIDLSQFTEWELGKHFDYSVLPKQTTEADIRSGCQKAVRYNCAAFYPSSSYWLPVIVEELAGSDVLPAAALSFPFGSTTAAMKGKEAEEAIQLGARSLDMAMNIGALKSGRIGDVREECRVFADASGDALTKVILETCYLSPEEIKLASELVVDAGLDYVKSSSGQFDGPSMDDILIMLSAVKGTPTKVKVAGVKFPRPQNAYAFLLAGVDLIGTRAAPEILDALDQMRSIGLVPAYSGKPAVVGA